MSSAVSAPSPGLINVMSSKAISTIRMHSYLQKRYTSTLRASLPPSPSLPVVCINCRNAARSSFPSSGRRTSWLGCWLGCKRGGTRGWPGGGIKTDWYSPGCTYVGGGRCSKGRIAPGWCNLGCMCMLGGGWCSSAPIGAISYGRAPVGGSHCDWPL